MHLLHTHYCHNTRNQKKTHNPKASKREYGFSSCPNSPPALGQAHIQLSQLDSCPTQFCIQLHIISMFSCCNSLHKSLLKRVGCCLPAL